MDTLQKLKTTPKDFFFWISAIVALYMSAISLLVLLFEYIDVLFVDPLRNFQDPFSGAIRFSIASLIIIFPIYLLLTRIINQGIRANPQKKEVGVRKWLIFLTLFVAGVTIIIDLIVLINTFLGGEQITAGFILKVTSVLVVIGGVFLYYFYDLHGKWVDSKSASQAIGGFISLVVLGAIVGGFLIIGSPQTQRLIRFDQDKINDLSSIQWQVVNFYQQKERLPQSLNELEDPLVGFIVPEDSQTDDSYGYDLVGGLTFELCAVFNKESRGQTTDAPRAVKIGGEYGFESENWAHNEGRTCFDRTIDPEKFPPIRR